MNGNSDVFMSASQINDDSNFIVNNEQDLLNDENMSKINDLLNGKDFGEFFSAEEIILKVEEPFLDDDNTLESLHNEMLSLPSEGTHFNDDLGCIDEILDNNDNHHQDVRSKCKKKSTIPTSLLLGGPDKRNTVEKISLEDFMESEKTKKKVSKTKEFQCKYCNERFTKFQDMKSHTIVHQKETRHKCPECQKCFTRAHDLTLHSRVHSGERPFVCEFCQKGFTQKINMLRHVRTHTDDRPFACKICKKRCIDQGDLARHVRLHNGELPHFCMICKARFAKLHEMKKHVAVEHSQASFFECNICNLTFSDRSSKRKHKEQVHSVPFICNDCGKNFKLKIQLIRHMRVHSGDQNQKSECRYCCKQFATKATCIAHMKRHLGSKSHVCEICSMKFYERHLLNRHIRTHTDERPYPCDLCPMTFKTSYTRKCHVKGVHEQTMRIWKCEFRSCREKFTSKKNMMRHMRNVHYRMKPFACAPCGKAFSSKTSLVCHEKSRHTTEREYTCAECSKQFAYKVLLKRHIGSQHM